MYCECNPTNHVPLCERTRCVFVSDMEVNYCFSYDYFALFLNYAIKGMHYLTHTLGASSYLTLPHYLLSSYVEVLYSSVPQLCCFRLSKKK